MTSPKIVPEAVAEILLGTDQSKAGYQYFGGIEPPFGLNIEILLFRSLRTS